jgi:hypothetical protein
MQLAALSVIILLAIAWRGFVWRHVPLFVRTLLNLAGILRFVSIALHAFGLLDSTPLHGPAADALAITLDLSIILSR